MMKLSKLYRSLRARGQNAEMRRNIRLIEKSNLFDEGWYRRAYPDLSGKNINLIQHYLEHGAKEGRNPSEEFYTTFYLNRNPDVAAEGINPLIHYIKHGKAEERKAKLHFDADFYLNLYPHIANHPLTPLQHYLSIGRPEGRYAYFDAAWYIAEYPELAHDVVNPRDHFLRFGQFEGRHPYFDAEWYKEIYPEVAAKGISATEHYRTIGSREGRHAAFDLRFYLEDNPDLNPSEVVPLQHYLSFGRFEGRYPAFHRAWYVRAYRDVRASGLDPYRHYMNTGRQEARPLSPSDFSEISRFGQPNIWADVNAPFDPAGHTPTHHPNFSPKISIIVPNYNHASYLPDRLESIYNQTYKNFEVILLDDCSTDESQKILRAYERKNKHNTKCIFNKVNSGGVFRQWKRGLQAASGDLIWIAESDDYCAPNFLYELVRFFRNNAVMLAFCRTDFVNGSTKEKVWTSESYWEEAEIRLGQSDFVKSAHEIVEEAWSFRNIAANVSGVIFRRPGQLSIFDDEAWLRLRMCGDWIFYLAMIRGGLVGYSPYTTNYYRQHPKNTSVNTHNDDIYYREHAEVAKFLVKNYKVSSRAVLKSEEVLYKHWCMKRGTDRLEEFRHLFDIREIGDSAFVRRANVFMASYAIIPGGGETFPILLANLLYERGYAVTFVNYEREPTNSGIRSTLNASIPILEFENSADTKDALVSMGVELVHSHHAWVDLTLSFIIEDLPSVARVVTMHGMYELLDQNYLSNKSYKLSSTDEWVYIADKNLDNSLNTTINCYNSTKITNTVDMKPLQNLRRTDYGLKSDDFVVCLASRAVPDKGWQEAIDAVIMANRRSSRRIQLLLVGEGPEYDRISKLEIPDYIHLLGFQRNVRDFFNISDIGLIASRFRGESCPLVLIECLSVDKPVLSSNIGEVPQMLAGETGQAGITFELKKWQIDSEEISDILVNIANDTDAYNEIARHAGSAARKFDPSVMLDQYISVYDRALKKRSLISLRRPLLSVVLVTYNMRRELPRTLYTLSSEFQRLSPYDYEIIVIDNGSSQHYDIADYLSSYPNVTFSSMMKPGRSPVPALQHGIAVSRGEVVCAFIDAARMASPGLLRLGLDACRSGEDVFVGALSYHLGHEPQNESVKYGYNQIVEDALLNSINWRKSGYDLFKISSFDPSSRFGLFACPAETNSLFMSRRMWSKSGGFDERFTGAGGGLANLDLWSRLCQDRSNKLIMLLGEGTFHQFHGGVATNSPIDRWSALHDEYVEIRGEPFIVPTRAPIQYGMPHKAVLEFVLRREATKQPPS